jgi:hypothetical protein
MKSAKYSYFSEHRSSALGPPISNLSMHVASSVLQLNTLPNTPSSKSSVQATNDRKPNVEIARRAEETLLAGHGLPGCLWTELHHQFGGQVL